MGPGKRGSALLRSGPALQLVDHPFIKPSAIHSHEVLEGYADEFLYLGCVKFVKQASSSGGGAGWGCGRAPS